MSIGGSKSKGGGSQSSESESVDFGTNVWGTQSPYLADLYRKSQNTLNNSYMSQVAGALYAQDAGKQAGNASQSIAQSNAWLKQFQNPTVDPAVNAYAKNLGQQFSEQFLPQLKGDAALAGGLGGSRQQIGSALGAQRAMQSLSDFSANAYAGQQERSLAAAQALQQGAALSQANAATQLDNAAFQQSLPWYGLSQYAGLLGSPVTRSLGSRSSGTSSGSSKSGSSGFNFGFGSG